MSVKPVRPKAVLWYELYCHIFGLLNLWTAWKGYSIARDPMGFVYRTPLLADKTGDQDMNDFLELAVGLLGWTFLGVGLAFGLAAFILPRTHDNKKMWKAHLVHLAFGMTSGFLLPLCLPVFLAYLKPEVKTYYGVLPPKEK